MLRKIWEYAVVIGMALLMALNYEIFVFENAFAPAGLNGIATMIQYKLDFSVGYMNLLVNIPLCIMAYVLLNRDYAAKTLTFCLSLSAFMLAFRYGFPDVSAFVYHTDNGTSTVLAPVAAGVINGFIYGTVLKQNASTGGTDIAAAAVHKLSPGQNVVWVIFAINCAVAGVSFFVYDYKFEPVILCVLYSFLTGQISDRIVRGGKEKVKFEIVTKDAATLSAALIRGLGHGVTVVPAKGAFTGEGVSLLICVIDKHQVIALQRILKEYPDSFAYVSAVSETLGNFRHSSIFEK